jgi:predicted glycosyltransferase
VLFIKGVIENEQQISEEKNLTIYNYMTSSELENALNESHLIVSRSGYTTLMDLTKLNKKAFFIPTPGQYEQEYLAERLTEQGLVASSKQDDFTIGKLDDISNFKGLSAMDYEVNFKKLFSLFKGK